MPSPCAVARVAVELALRPLEITVYRGERRLLRSLGAWVAEGTVHDHFIQLTEGVVAQEELSPVERALSASVRERSQRHVVLALELGGGRRARLEVRLSAPDRVTLELEPDGDPLRAALDWRRRSDERFVGLGARHCTQFDQAGRAVQLGADRRYTGPDCPAELLAAGGIPQGDYAPVPWLVSSRGYAVWVRSEANGIRFDLAGERVAVSTRSAAGPLALEVFCHADAGGAAAGVLPGDRASRPSCPSGATGSGRAATSTSTRTTSATTSTACAGTTSRSTRS